MGRRGGAAASSRPQVGLTASVGGRGTAHRHRSGCDRSCWSLPVARQVEGDTLAVLRPSGGIYPGDAHHLLACPDPQRGQGQPGPPPTIVPALPTGPRGLRPPDVLLSVGGAHSPGSSRVISRWCWAAWSTSQAASCWWMMLSALIRSSLLVGIHWSRRVRSWAPSPQPQPLHGSSR